MTIITQNRRALASLVQISPFSHGDTESRTKHLPRVDLYSQPAGTLTEGDVQTFSVPVEGPRSWERVSAPGASSTPAVLCLQRQLQRNA